MPAARSLWNGTITFGAVAIPVKLFSATSPHALRFKEVRASDGSRVEHKRIGADSGEEIPYGEIEKAYDTGKGQIVLTKEEIAAAEGSHPKVIAIERFVPGEQIDPVFYDKAYHVGAQKDGGHAYRVLLAALERSGTVGIGRFVLRTREQLVALRPLHGALGLQTMRFDDELVDPSDLELPSLKKKPGEREVKMAGKLVEMLAGDWDPDEHEDTYRDAVLEMIERKRKGQKPKKARRRPDTGDDLAAALEASLAGGRPDRKAKASGRSSTSRSASKASSGAKASSKTTTGSKATAARSSSKSSGAAKSSTKTASGKAAPKSTAKGKR
ncbi:non-homologous end joining protein Ku [Patulibacter sp. S7RM1-6]